MKKISSYNTGKKILKKKRWSYKIVILLIIPLLVWFSGSFIFQNSFGMAGSRVGNTITVVKNKILFWRNENFSNEDIVKLKEENQSLVKENSQLKEKIKESSIKFENNDLESQYEIKKVPVIGKDNFLNIPILYLGNGSNDNLVEGMAVLDSKGALIGTLDNIQLKICQAKLTPNRESRINARIAGTDWNGVVEGNLNLRAEIKMLPIDSTIKEGDEVVSDNSNPNIPPGILMGTIDETRESDDHLFKEALLNLPWDSKNMSDVWVITNKK